MNIFDEPEAASSSDDQKRRANDVLTVLSTQQGRRFVWSLLSAGGVYTPGILSEYSCGQRDMALALRQEIMALDAEHYTLMEKENRA